MGVWDRRNLSKYLKKQARFDAFTQPSNRSADLTVVIPCYGEEAISDTLLSLFDNEQIDNHVEIIVVINHGENSDKSVKELNYKSLIELKKIAKEAPNWCQLLLIDLFDLPEKASGVGVARKTGMDEAVRRLDESSGSDGIIVCLDADCTVERNYFKSIINGFNNHPGFVGATLHFEHPLETLYGAHRQAMAQYELYLRVHCHGLRWAGMPFGHYAVGSTIACRVSAYCQAQGMSRKKAGEDFYFIQKILQLGDLFYLNTTTVYPSARLSTRTPFGTGPALQQWLSESAYEPMHSYDSRCYASLATLKKTLDDSVYPIDFDVFMKNIDLSLADFFKQRGISCHFDRFNRESKNYEDFLKRLFTWFNGFQGLKYIHTLTRMQYPKQAIGTVACRLLAEMEKSYQSCEIEALLEQFRSLDRLR
ncbi:MAG: glycosyltransferase [Magnetococcales bacterium]|nr:glycosyltransferase [Magnetococcales bacterium]